MKGKEQEHNVLFIVSFIEISERAWKIICQNVFSNTLWLILGQKENFMASCKFSNELNRLRKSSSDSIDDIEEFDSFKKYMHVVRACLKNILHCSI